ncbi:sugar phosphate isomerase/epimerase family protein [Paenibacillus thailandensis]|uniref:Sugar phosphate isomerase/epimerase family protein n=1 Tax=Paenibacillus thailandensis TaxID=393250 RepID=A0ABW5QUP3_9BACL
MSIQAGINVFSVHERIGDDYFGALEQLAEAGYRNLELISFNMKKRSRLRDDFPSEAVSGKLKELGLAAIAVHEGPMPGQELLEHDWDNVMAYYGTLGTEAIVLPSVWIQDRESALRLAEQLGVLGKRLKDNGFALYLHNHAHEFKSDGETTLFDLLADNTDPELLKFELDMVWAMRAGIDPVAVLERLGSRCDMVHQKDLNKELAGPVNLFEAIKRNGDEALPVFEAYQKYIGPADFVDLGTGTFDFASVYKRINEMGSVKYALVENEGRSSDKIESVRNDLKVLQSYL